MNFNFSRRQAMKPDSPIIATKPLWHGTPDIESSGIRFMCPICFEWVKKEVLEEHVAAHNNGPQPE
jgi:hypothetical protein